MYEFANYLANFDFLIYSGIALSFLLFGFAIGYRLGKEDAGLE